MNVEQLLEDHDIIFLTKFGSHLYGTNTPNSDTDYKGVYVPSMRDIMLGRIPKTLKFDTNTSNEKNTSEDIDCEIYSIHYFLELAARGETVAIDMLHANEENIIKAEERWDMVRENRSMFYTTDMRAFVGYCRKQAAKYGIKGSRLASAEKLKEFFESHSADDRLVRMIEAIPTDGNITVGRNIENTMTVINFCGKQIQETVKVSYALDIVEKFIEQYGHRAKLAERNEGVDWKAMSHAVRAAMQLEEIYVTNDLTFPLRDATLLKEIKSGDMEFQEVLDILERYMDQIERLSTISNLPSQVDRKEVDDLCLKVVTG